MVSTVEGSRRALALALGGLGLLPAVLVVVAVLPEGWRGPAYLFGLTCAAATSLAGGVRGFRSVSAGSGDVRLAVAAAIVGLTAGVTVAVLVLLSVLSLLG